MNLPLIAVVHNWRNERNKSGLYSLHLRITIDRDSRYYKIPVPKKVTNGQWNGKEDAWVKNHPFVIRFARKDNYIDPSQMEFLFDDVKIKVNRAKRTFLEPQEIKTWREVRFPTGKEYLARDRDMFLFQIYTGYYYKDLLLLPKISLWKMKSLASSSSGPEIKTAIKP
jgi:hypothetical protein